MQGFRITCNLKNGTCRWHGMETGKTTLVQLNPVQRVVMFHVAGHTYWSGHGQRSYAPARYEAFHVSGLSGVGENSVELCLGATLFDYQGQSKNWPHAPDQLAENIVHIYHGDDV